MFTSSSSNMFTSSSIHFHAPIIHHHHHHHRRLSFTTSHSLSFHSHNHNHTFHTPSFLRPPPLLNPSPPSIFTVASMSSTPDKASEQKWVHEGLITESLSNGMFRVLLDNQDLVLGYISGKIRKNYVRILPGDRVKVEVSRYDSSKGRIIYRLRNTTGGSS